MNAARRRSEEMVDEAREDAKLLRYLATDVLASGPSFRDSKTDVEVVQRALLAGYRQLLAHAHNLEHCNAIWDRLLDE